MSLGAQGSSDEKWELLTLDMAMLGVVVFV